MSVAQLGQLIVCVHPNQAHQISELDWDAFCRVAEAAEQSRGDVSVLVVVPSGAVPNPKQRQQFTSAVSNAHLAILCDRPAQRIVVNLLSMFVRTVKAFQVDDIAGGLAFLKSEHDADALAVKVEWVRNRTGIESESPEARREEP